jgi:allantoate deiminase
MIDGPRLLARIDELAAVGADPRGGVTRLAYTDDDLAGRELVAGWLREAGAAVRVDTAGNLIGELAGSEPGLAWLATGSHLDSVVQAGPLDGAYGVVAAVEVVAALTASGGGLRHPLRVVGFSNEEGAHGTAGMTGSGALAARSLPLDSHDDDGIALADRIRYVGGDPTKLDESAWAPGEIEGFIELHVEQGPVLELAGKRVGVVTGITGRATAEVFIGGKAQHAGTTPMEARRDAAVVAARVVLAVQELALSGQVRVATAGRVHVEPGVRNVIPGVAAVSVEVRDLDEARMHAALAELELVAARLAAAEGCTSEVQQGSWVSPVATDLALQGCVARAAEELGYSAIEMPSGAGHDAQVVADVVPVAMAFVPSTGGVSHASDETTPDDDLVAGAELLLAALRQADALSRGAVSKDSGGTP